MLQDLAKCLDKYVCAENEWNPILAEEQMHIMYQNFEIDAEEILKKMK